MARKKRQSKKQRAASLRNLAKARRSRKRGKRRVVREAAETPRRRRKRRTAKKRAHTKRRRKHVAAAAPRRRRRRVKKSAVRRRRRRSHAKEAPHQIRRSRRSGRFAKRKKYGRHTTKLIGHITGESRRRRRRRKGYAMENPLSVTELVVGGLTMLVGAGSASLVDRFLATHALTDKNAKDANGNELYADPGAADGPYKGMFNAAAIEAPMDLKRWLAAGGMVLVPFAASGMVKSGAGRSSLQLFAFGALVAGGGRAAKDLVAKLTKSTATGQRLFDAPMRAAALKAGDGSEASLVSAGLGSPQRRLGCGRCANCRTGIGACCYSNPAGNSSPPSPPAPPIPVQGGGLPPGFHEPLPPPQVVPPAPAPPPPAPPGGGGGYNTPGFTGVPRGMGRPVTNGSRLRWGAEEDNAD